MTVPSQQLIASLWRTNGLIPHTTSMTWKFWVDKQSASESDNQANFLQNLQTQPDDWRYRTVHLVYKMNANYFRANDLASYDWDQSIMVIGSSEIFGVGLAEDEVLPAQLSKILGRPCINMSGIGTGNNIIQHNIDTLLTEVTPKAIVINWSPFDMWTYPHHQSDRWIQQYANPLGDNNYAPLYTPQFKKDLESGYITQTAFECIAHTNQLLTSKRIPFVQFAFFDIMSMPGYDRSLHGDFLQVEVVDRARNLVNPGISTMQNIAAQAATILKPAS